MKKVILFIMCVICAIVFMASVAGAVVMVEENVYGISKESAKDELAFSIFESRADKAVNDWAYDKSVLFIDDTFQFKILDKSGIPLSHSYYGNNQSAPTGDFDYTIKFEKIADDVYWHNQYGRRQMYAWAAELGDNEGTGEYVTVKGRLVETIPATSEIYWTFLVMDLIYALKFAVYAIIVGSFILGIIFFVNLMRVSGRKPGTEEIKESFVNKIPYDLLVVGCVAVCGIFMAIISSVNEWMAACCLGIVFILVFVVMGLGMCMEMAVRIKLGTLFKRTLTYIVLKFVFTPVRKLWRFNVDIIKNLNLLWKAILIIAAVNVAELCIMGLCWFEMDNLMVVWILSRFVVLPLEIYVVLSLRRLEKSGEALAAGNLTYYTDVNGLIGPFKKHGNNLNSIGAGMQLAIEDRIKSERMKTELITNVSHDIKTPLTSIINYAGLITEEECDNEKIHEYSEVLVRQSDRLKRLIEDLVEASKASTGNLEVELVECDPSNFIVQVDGEYEEKLSASDLTLVVHSSEKEARIMADGRRMWRIFDNLMNNICKYAQPGTRVYLTLEITDDSAIFIFKNTSRDALDMTESELMERFVRGDKSRNTEGNGLGLSIAKSLAELQNGNLRLIIDGDLFKAILTFPRVK